MALPGPTSVVTTESRRSYTACIPASASQLQQPVHWIGECVGLFEVGTGKAGDVLALAGCTSSSPSRSDSREPRPQEVVYLVYFILGRVSPRTLTRSTRRLDLWLGFACTACSQVSRATWVFRLQIAQPLAAVPTASGFSVSEVHPLCGPLAGRSHLGAFPGEAGGPASVCNWEWADSLHRPLVSQM